MRECDVVYFTIVSRSNQTSVIFLPFAGRVSFAARTCLPRKRPRRTRPFTFRNHSHQLEEVHFSEAANFAP